jgi:hypothetical protein
MYDFANPKYEDMIKWINNHKAHGDTWEQIKYACKGNVEELREFLEIAPLLQMGGDYSLIYYV